MRHPAPAFYELPPVISHADGHDIGAITAHPGCGIVVPHYLQYQFEPLPRMDDTKPGRFCMVTLSAIDTTMPRDLIMASDKLATFDSGDDGQVFAERGRQNSGVT
jgi:hypothetical protein